MANYIAIIELQGAASEGPQPRRLRRCDWVELGMSREEFADFCGLDRTYIGGIERGERNVSLVNIEKLAKALHITLSELFRRL
jgi:DNA-binding XRE family transcriptional regulator